MSKWIRRWKATWIPFGAKFQKGYVEEWEQQVRAPEYSGQESEYRWKDPNSWSWDTQDLSDRETFARLTHESSDGRESICGSYWAPKPANSECFPSHTFKCMNDGWDASRESPLVPPGLLSTPQSSWQPYSDGNASRSYWALRKYEKQVSARPAGRCLMNHWTYLHRLNESYLRLHIFMVLYPYDFLCRAQTTKSSLVMTKTSRQAVPSRSFAMPMTEGSFLPSRSALTTACPTVYSSRYASAS